MNYRDMNWKQKIDYFKKIGAFATADIARDNKHPLWLDASEYMDEKE